MLNANFFTHKYIGIDFLSESPGGRLDNANSVDLQSDDRGFTVNVYCHQDDLR